MAYDLDEIDERLLSLLQENARYAATELAERVGVSDNTIHNRMQRLEDEGVITGYTASVDHERTGMGLYFMFIGTARISRRSEVATEALSIPEVVEVVELMTGQRNVLIKVYGAEDEDITRVAEQLDDLDLRIEDESLVREEHVRPLEYADVDVELDEE